MKGRRVVIRKVKDNQCGEEVDNSEPLNTLGKIYINATPVKNSLGDPQT